MSFKSPSPQLSSLVIFCDGSYTSHYVYYEGQDEVEASW